MSFDKPGSPSDADFDALIDTVKANNSIFHVSYMYRYNPAVMYAMEKIKNGDKGEVISIEGQMNIRHADDLRARYGDYPGGIMYYLGCHITDIIYRVMGEPLEVIPMNCKTGLGGVDSVDFGMAALRYDHGVSFVKVNATEVGGAPMRRYLIFAGTKGTLEINPIERPCGNGLDLTKIRETYEGDPSVYRRSFPPYGRYTKMLEEFAAMVRGEKKNPYDYEYEKGLHTLIMKTCGE